LLLLFSYENKTFSPSPDGSGILAGRFAQQDITYSGTTRVVRKEVVLLEKNPSCSKYSKKTFLKTSGSCANVSDFAPF
jgi:hypothetical protein